MKDVNTTENLRLWLRKCPAITDFPMARFNVDYLGGDPTEFALFSSPSTINSRRDILGNVYYAPIQELNYQFVSLRSFSRDILSQLENLGFFTQVMKWIYDQNVEKNLPEIAEGKVLSIMPTLSPYLFDASTDTGRYQIQLKLKYRI